MDTLREMANSVFSSSSSSSPNLIHASGDPEEAAKERGEKLDQAVKTTWEATKEKAADVKEGVADAMEATKDKAVELKDKAADKIQEMKSDAQENTEETDANTTVEGATEETEPSMWQKIKNFFGM